MKTLLLFGFGIILFTLLHLYILSAPLADSLKKLDLVKECISLGVNKEDCNKRYWE